MQRQQGSQTVSRSQNGEHDEQGSSSAVLERLRSITSVTSETPSSTAKQPHLYHGHRRASFTTNDIDELTELRARRERGCVGPTLVHDS